MCCVRQVNNILMFMDPKEKTKCNNNYTAHDTTPSGVHIPQLYGVYNLQDVICLVYNLLVAVYISLICSFQNFSCVSFLQFILYCLQKCT